MKKLSTLALGATLLCSVAVAKEFVTIGTGSMTGTYYPVGGAICRLVNMNKDMKCSVQSTGGSVYNVNNVLKKELNFGFVQSDVAYDKFNGKGKFVDDGNQDLRSVISIYPELLAFVVSKESGIKSYNDLAGKNINVGNPGSGNEVTALIVYDAYKFDVNKLGHRGVLAVNECPMALKDKKIDGYYFMVGHPTANITDAANSLPIDLVGIDDDKMGELLEKYPYFAKAVLVASKDQSDESVKAVVKAILDNFDEYKKLHPALGLVTKESLVEGLSAPLHPAAEAVFKEAGILK